MATTFMHLAAISIVMGIVSLFDIHLWIWLPVISSITITVHLLIINRRFASLMEMTLTKHMDHFSDPVEIGMLKASPGIFIPQILFRTYLARTDMAASLGWVRLLSFAAVVLGIIYRNYFLSTVGGAVFLIYLFSHIGGMFYAHSQEANMFACVRRYLSRVKKNVKSVADGDLQIYALKYQDIIDKLNTIYNSKEPGCKIGPSDRAPKDESA